MAQPAKIQGIVLNQISYVRLRDGQDIAIVPGSFKEQTEGYSFTSRGVSGTNTYFIHADALAVARTG